MIQGPPRSTLFAYTTLFRSQTRMGVQAPRRALCVFEHIYFARPDSRLDGQVLQVARGRMGEILARDHPADGEDRKSTRLNSSHANISYAVFCLNKQISTSI